MTYLEHSRALWNRSHLDLRSEELLAQILERGSMDDWREIYQRSSADAELRARLRHVVTTVPLPFAHFWLAALASLGEDVDLAISLPSYADQGI